MPLIVGAVSAIVYLSTAAYGAVSGDVNATNVLSWQLATTGDATFTDETFPPLDDHPLRDVWIKQTSEGREVIARLPGGVVAAIPAYWVWGGEQFSAVPGGITAAIIAAVSVVLFSLLLRDHLSARDAALAGLVFGLTTPVWSVAANGIWPHTITVLGICGMGWAASRDKWWLVGLFGGVAIWGRLHVALIVALVGLAVGLRRHDLRIPAKVGLTSGALLALYCAWMKSIYGSWNPTASYGLAAGDNPFNTSENPLVNQLGFWVSLDRGILVWSPVIILIVPALVRSWSRLPDWSRTLVWGGLAYTVVQGMRNPFGGGESFYGYRLTLELLACAAPALAISAPFMGRYARLAFGPVLAFQAFIISVGAINEGVASPEEEAWTTHTLISAMAHEPVFLAGFVVLSIGIGALGQRIWAEPGVAARVS